MQLSDHKATLAGTVALLLVVQLAVVAVRSGQDRTLTVDEVPAVDDVAAPERTAPYELAPPPVTPDAAAPTPAQEPSPTGPTAAAVPEPDNAAAPTGDAGTSSDGLRPVTPDEDAGDGTAPPSNEPPPPRNDPPPQQQPPAQSAPQDPARARFEQRFPGHAQATQDVNEPATTRWALIIGVNDHQGRTTDNRGSRQDAEELWQHLVNLGWRQDHVLLLTDGTATRENIEQGIAWLARKTDASSLAVFHFSGHIKKWYGQDADGDGEVTDEGLWPSDNRHMIDSEFVARMAAVNAGQLWIDLGGCNTAGMGDPGLERRGRLITYSSTEDEKSYEDPRVGNSVWGYYLVDQALMHRHGDANGDGNVTVEEAFNYAAPRAAQRTQGQRYGAQHAVVSDKVEGDVDLRIPAPPRQPEPEPEPEPSDPPDDGEPCTLLCTAPSTWRR